jgi:lactoylglutathione lyase
MKIEHIALWTPDLEQSRVFYETYFGVTASKKYRNIKTQFESYFLTFEDGARLEIMQRPDIHQRIEQPALGWHHLAMSVGSQKAVNTLTERLRKAGYTIASEPRTTGDGYYESVVLDPDGNAVEITT